MMWKLNLFLIGYPYGLMGQIILKERGEAKYTLWDRSRYFILVGEGALR